MFQYTHNTGKRGNFSCWYPSKSHAARAIWVWAGDNWHSKVVRSAPQAPSPPKKKQDDLEAPWPQQVDMTQPLTQLEFHIVKHAHFVRRVTKAGKEYVMFTYKPGWGPATKANLSRWYPSKEGAARALSTWAGEDWWQRVKTTMTFAPEDEEDQTTLLIREVRQNYLMWLEHALTPEVLQAIREDLTGQVLGQIVEDDYLSRLISSFAQGEGVALQDVLHLVLQCEKDAWGTPVVWGGPVAVQGVLARKKLSISCKTVASFVEQGPGQDIFLLLHHSNHFVPAWAPTFHGPCQSRPWIGPELRSFEGPFAEACQRHGWHWDATTRAGGDCAFHGVVLYQALLAKATPLPLAEADALPPPEIGPLPLPPPKPEPLPALPLSTKEEEHH